jgi:hypothetical protein
MFRVLEPGNDRPDRGRAIDAIATTLGRSLSPLCTLLSPEAIILDDSLPMTTSPSLSRTCTSFRANRRMPSFSAAPLWRGAWADVIGGDHAAARGAARPERAP